MRPTIDEQLAGALRLIEAIERENHDTAAAAELAGNARRLVAGVRRALSAGPSLIEDNAALEQLLQQLGRPAVDDGQATPGLRQLITRNNLLRAELTQVIQASSIDDRINAKLSMIGTYLRHGIAHSNTRPPHGDT